MGTHANDSAYGYEAFLRDAPEFNLGSLVTEAAHPRSGDLSDLARHDAADGLRVLFDVDRDVVETYDRWSRSGAPEALRDLVRDALAAGGRLFFTGCGATGRLSIQLASIWRGFWQDRRERGQTVPPPDEWEPRALSVMAGGDYALTPFVSLALARYGSAAESAMAAARSYLESRLDGATSPISLAMGAYALAVLKSPLAPKAVDRLLAMAKHGTSGSFAQSMKKDGGSGREDGTGAYIKPAGGAPNDGAVYTVAGSSGQIFASHPGDRLS